MASVYREASPNEKLYIASQKCFSPLNIQCVFEGKGSIVLPELKQAVRLAADHCPGAKLVYKNGFWIESDLYPKVFELTSDTFNGYNFEVLNLANQKMDVYTSPPIEVIVLKGKTQGLIFRIFHGLMDGKGALLWIENVFRALRGQAVMDMDSKHTDLSFLKTQSYTRYKSLHLPHINVFKNNKETNTYSDINTLRVSIEGDYKSLLAKVAKVFTDHFEDTSSLFMVPVSLRSLDESMQTTANMVLPIFLHTRKEETYKSISQQLIKKIAQKKYLNLNNANLGILRFLPTPSLAYILKAVGTYCNKTRKHLTSGTLSYVGRYDEKEFSTPSFTCRTFYSMPLCTPFSPVSVVMYKNTHSIEISISHYRSVISEDQMNAIARDLVEEVKEIRLYNSLNNTTKIQSEKSLVDIFKDVVHKYGKNIAVQDNLSSMTYSELDVRSNQLALKLRREFHKDEKCKDEKSVLIFMNRSISFVVSVLACLKAGVTFVPVEVGALDKSTSELLGNFNGKILVTENTQSLLTDIQTFDNLKDKLINVESVHINTVSYKDLVNAPKASNIKSLKYSGELSGQPLYRIYTSGSTGQAKGVNISHDNIKNYLLWAKNKYNISENDGFAFFTSTSVDLTITSYLLPLICGAKIVVYPEALSSVLLKDILTSSSVNCIKATPTHLKLIHDLKLDGTHVSKKKLLILGGEHLSYDITLKGQNLLGPECQIVNEYGPTETTIGCTAFFVKDKGSGQVPIGNPIDNTKVIILNDSGQIVKQGQVGEVFIGGACVGLGYHENDPLTKGSFVNVKGEIYYKSGDIAYLNDACQLVYVSRKDRQVKIHGRRVELSAIESAFTSFDKSWQFKIVYDNEKGKLIAFYTKQTLRQTSNWRTFANANLKAHLRPTAYVEIDSYPLKSSGKLDENALLKVWSHMENKCSDNDIFISDKGEDLGVKSGDEHPSSKLELELMEEVGLLLGMKSSDMKRFNMNISKNIMDIGGDSLTFIQLTDFAMNAYLPHHHHRKFMEDCIKHYDELSVKNLAKILSQFSK